MRRAAVLLAGLALLASAGSASAQQSQAIEINTGPPTQEVAGVAYALAGSIGEQAAAQLDAPEEVAASDVPVVTLEEVIDAGLARNPGLQALDWKAWATWAQADGVSAQGGLGARIAITSMMTDSPLGVFGSRLSQGRVTQADFDPTVLNNPDYLGNTEFKLSLQYALYDAGRIDLVTEALQFGSQAVEYEQLAAGQQLIGGLTQAYFNHALLNDQLKVLEEARLTTEELVRVITSLEREGLKTRSDIAAAEVELANVEHEITKAKARLSLVETTIYTLTGIEAPFRTSVPDIYGVVDMPELSDITDLALHLHPSICAAESNAYSAGLMVSESKRRRLPTVGLFAEAKHSTPGLPDEGHSESTFGAMLNFDLDTNGAISATIEEREAMEQSALWYLDHVSETVELNVAQTFSELGIAYSGVETFQQQSVKAAENFRVVDSQYREGLTNYLDLRLALTTRTESKLREIKSRHDYLTSYFALLVSAGLAGSDHDPILGEEPGRFEPIRLELESKGVPNVD